jgi:hypothetical protein
MVGKRVVDVLGTFTTEGRARRVQISFMSVCSNPLRVSFDRKLVGMRNFAKLNSGNCGQATTARDTLLLIQFSPEKPNSEPIFI